MSVLPFDLSAQAPASIGFQLVDVTGPAGLQFRHNSGAYGGKLLPETLGSGCAFIDYDADGWQDILFVNGMDWPGHRKQRSTLQKRSSTRGRWIAMAAPYASSASAASDDPYRTALARDDPVPKCPQGKALEQEQRRCICT